MQGFSAFRHTSVSVAGHERGEGLELAELLV
jgi:hypothetical protein